MWIKRGKKKVQVKYVDLNMPNELANRQLLQKAAELARQHAMHSYVHNINEVNVGAAIIDGNGIIVGHGMNEMKKSHPRLLTFYPFPFVHAEAAAVISMGRHKAKNGIVVVVRVGSGGQLRNCRPCAHCQNFLFHHGVRMAVFSNEKGEFETMPIRDQAIWIPSHHSLQKLESCG